MSKQTEEQNKNLNEKFNEVESALAKAKVYSNQAGCKMASVERRFLSCFLFGRAVTSFFLSLDSSHVANHVSLKLADQAEGIQNDISNRIAEAYCFTDAESMMCPCNANDLDDLDVYDCLLENLRRGEGQHVFTYTPHVRLSDALLPFADYLIAIAGTENDPQAMATAQRIRTLLRS